MNTQKCRLATNIDNKATFHLPDNIFGFDLFRFFNYSSFYFFDIVSSISLRSLTSSLNFSFCCFISSSFYFLFFLSACISIFYIFSNRYPIHSSPIARVEHFLLVNIMFNNFCNTKMQKIFNHMEAFYRLLFRGMHKSL